MKIYWSVVIPGGTGIPRTVSSVLKTRQRTKNVRSFVFKKLDTVLGIPGHRPRNNYDKSRTILKKI